jgi:hypothetical protein
MTTPSRWTRGEPLTASRLNDMRGESVRPRRDISIGNGSSLVNETLGNQSANMRRPFIKCVTAVEDFEIQAYPTDLNGVFDDVPSGLVSEVRLSRSTGIHGIDTASPFRAWDVLGGLNGVFCTDASDSASGSTSSSASASVSDETSLTTKVACDVFYVIYNEDSKRWEVLSGTGSGGVREIRFLIVTAFPESLKVYGQILSWDYGYSISDVPARFGFGSDGPTSLNVVEICDPAGCFFNEPEEELMGRQGSAKYTQGVRDDICRVGSAPYQGVWEVHSLCCLNPSCDVTF